ncbi:MAG: hypothetical protein IH859_00215 [Chloroflexi bacterium]|nr:hypothetical protein [Chloroflexota bacterium]
MVKDEKSKVTKLEIGLPFNLGKITLEPDKAQQYAAWELYVELTTRISVQSLAKEEGLVREALSSLYNLFNITRDILRRAGPSVAQGSDSLGPIAIDVLNLGLRPFTSKWHPELQIYESQRPENLSPKEHEDNWEMIGIAREELETLREELSIYADALAKIAGVNH